MLLLSRLRYVYSGKMKDKEGGRERVSVEYNSTDRDY